MDRPNIILINCDDLGYGDLGCFGSPLNTTPHLDRLASEGTRFTSFCMASAICSPSRAAMMTGCYPERVSINRVLFPGEAEGLNPSETTIASILKAQGYATSIVGKWHCGDQQEFMPTRFGFDSYYGIPYSNDMGRQAQRSSAYPPLPLVRNNEVIEQQPDQAGLTERYMEESVRFIRANRDRPFFLYLRTRRSANSMTWKPMSERVETCSRSNRGRLSVWRNLPRRCARNLATPARTFGERRYGPAEKWMIRSRCACTIPTIRTTLRSTISRTAGRCGARMTFRRIPGSLCARVVDRDGLCRSDET